MRPKWITGIVIGLFFLYVSYFGVAGIGLTLFPSRTTNLQVGMAWSTTEKVGTIYNPATHYYTYTVTSVVGTVVTVDQEEAGAFPISLTEVFDVTSTTKTDVDKAQVVASGLNIGDEVLEILNFGGTTIHGYVDALETLAEKTLLVSHFSTAILQFTAKYFQDSGVLYSLTEVTPLGTVDMYQCTSGDPVTNVPTYTITASAGIGGSISPSGAVTVSSGLSQTFNISPNNGYTILSVLVDGSNQGAVASYTFTNVQASHTISASFDQLPPEPTYNIIASAGVGGSISPSGTITVNAGASQTFTITSDSGYHILSVLIDGASTFFTIYTFTNVQANHTIVASFSVLPPNQYSISASAEMGGFISPSGSVLVNQGSNQAFAITANNGYIISAVLVDGVSQGTVSTYTFTNVQASHTISASFSSTENVNYFLLLALALLGNSRLMLILGASITLISVIMLFWPKPKPKYY